MRACAHETSIAQRLPAKLTTDDPAERFACGEYAISQFGPLAEICAPPLDEDELSKDGLQSIAAYTMRLKAGRDYLDTATHLVARSSTGRT